MKHISMANRFFAVFALGILIFSQSVMGNTVVISDGGLMGPVTIDTDTLTATTGTDGHPIIQLSGSVMTMIQQKAAKGDTGATGSSGTNGVTPTISLGSWASGTTMALALTPSGTNPNAYVLSGTLLSGSNGTNGATGASGTNGANALNPNYSFSGTAVASGGSPTVTVTGTYPNQLVTFGLVTGSNGATGASGTNGTNAVNPNYSLSGTAVPPGGSPTVTVSGTYPNQSIVFGLVTGSTGLTGASGTNGTNGTNAANPSYTFSGTAVASGGSPTVIVTGTYPNQTITFGLVTGSTGATGLTGASGTNALNPNYSFSGTAVPAGGSPTVTVTGTYPNQVITFGLVTGSTGATGTTGSPGTNGTNAVNPNYTLSSTAVPSGGSPTVIVTGTYPNQSITFGLVSGSDGVNATTTVIATSTNNGIMSSTQAAQLAAHTAQLSGMPTYFSVIKSSTLRSVVTSSTSTGWQVSGSRNARVVYPVSVATTATLLASATAAVVLEIAPTNSTTATDWVEIDRVGNSQNLALLSGIITLNSTQGTSASLRGEIPSGNYIRIRSVIVTGSAVITTGTGIEYTVWP